MRAIFPAPVLAAAVLLILTTSPAAPQTVPPPGTSPEEIRRQIEEMGLEGQIMDRIRSSGMSPEEIRQELTRRGYDPAILDAYLGTPAGSERSGSQPGAQPTGQVMSAVQALGLLGPAPMDSLDLEPTVREPSDSSAMERDRGLRVFGLDVFRRTTTQFAPAITGPVPTTYTVGAGDELVVILSGDVERGYTLPVSRDGFIVIPQVGQLFVSGLTMEQVRGQVFQRLSSAYSGLRRGPEATTQLQVSLGRLRPNQVFVTGQVAEPGAYLVGSVASTLNALYRGGGPTANGSFRDVRVMRGGRLAERVDLYSYLIAGDNISGVRLQPGDVVFVPTPHAQVSIEGEVIRPAIYEMLPDETLLDLVEFAGGLTAAAHLRQARITRILPPMERTVPGVDRKVITVDLAEIVMNPSRAPRLEPGDAVRIFPVRSEVRRTVSVEGGVWHEGTFAYEPGIRLWDLIEQAEGLREDAYTGRAQIMRIDPQDSTVTVIPVSLERDAEGLPVDNPPLREFDTVRVFAESRFTTEFPVTITGEVREAVVDTFQEGMTLRDLILKAGGLKPTADLTVEVARLARTNRSDPAQIAEIYRIPVDSTYFVSDQDLRHYLGEVPPTGPAAEFLLMPYDRVQVRPLADLEFQRSVEVRGEVRYPGHYTLERKDQRLSSLLERAGGLSLTAYPGGFRLFRDNALVNVDLEEVIRHPGGRNDLVLLPGDSVFVPEYNPVVLVQGAVNSPTPVAVLYQEGASLHYYIRQAGGYSRAADERRVNIRYANGEGATSQQVLAFTRAPRPLPGSVVTVPELGEDAGINWTTLIRDVAQMAGALTTVLLIIDRF